jgi:hypothetical protein
MDTLARFRCSSCEQMNTFRPALLDELFGDDERTGSFLTYHVACKHCRRSDLLMCRKPASTATAPRTVPAGI